MDREFVETSLFRQQIDSFEKGLLRKVQIEIIRNGSKAPFIIGTGGVQKIRVSRFGTGKSGGYRIFFLDLPEFGICYLLFILVKSESANISMSEKIEIKKLVEKLKRGG